MSSADLSAAPKAVRVEDFGRFDAASYGVMPADPPLGADEVRVEMEAIDTNFPDILYIEGRYQKLPARPFSPGLAGAGRVVAKGPQVEGLSLGQRVLALPEYGAYAARLVLPARYCCPVPDAMPPEVAAAFGLVYQTAWFALTARGQFRAGDRVLVLGASGGVGMAAVQIARALGAGQVIAASRGAEGMAFARALGADLVLDASASDLRESLRAQVMEATQGAGVDIVIDPVGGALAAASLRAIGWDGRFVVVGFASGEIAKFAANYLLVKNISVSGLQWTDYRTRQLEAVHAAQAALFDLWSQGRLTPHIERCLPLSRYGEALEALAQGRSRGKIILIPEGQGQTR